MVRVRLVAKIVQDAAQSVTGCVIDGGRAEGKKPRTEAGLCGAGQRSAITGLLSLLGFLCGLDGHQHLLVQSGVILAAKQR